MSRRTRELRAALRFKKLKFSIRSLLVLSAIIAAVCWWLTVPWSNARQFISKVNAQEYDRAAEMFAVEGRATMLTEWDKVGANAWLPNVSVSDYVLGLIRGRRRVEMTVMYLTPNNQESQGYFQLETSYRGIHVLDAPRDHNFKGSSVSNEVE